ncbi:MAG: zinc-binding dehydrogenase [Clostridia bacterium]|nr:zinc-binding dehydrogenase [Clostridia bacterium]
MLNKAVRLHGRNDLRLDTFELPALRDDEILVRVISDSICMSTYKAAIQGTSHKRVPANIAAHPGIVGHECCGVIERVGARWEGQFAPGERFTLQANMDYHGTGMNPGYAFEFCGGDTQRAILFPEIMEQGCLLKYRGGAFFQGSLSEPLSCIVGAFKAQYHTREGGTRHDMGIRAGGNMAILGGAGPMGLGAIDYTLHGGRRPGLLVVTDIDQVRLDRAARIHTVQEAAQQGVRLVYLNPERLDAEAALREISGDEGYDDVFVFTPKAEVVEQADALLRQDGCLNFFAGPTDVAFSARFNFYNAHYAAHHLVGTSGGGTADMEEAQALIAEGRLNPAGMITHVGGLNAVPETTLRLPEIPGGKKLIYTGVNLPLTAIDDFAALGARDALFAALAELCARHGGLWNAEAEAYLLAHADAI